MLKWQAVEVIPELLKASLEKDSIVLGVEVVKVSWAKPIMDS